MVEDSVYAPTTQEINDEYHFGRLHHIQGSPPWRWLKGGHCSRGRNRAGITTKFHLALTAEDHVVEGMLTGGNIPDITVAHELTADVVGCFVVEDKGYDSNKNR